MTSTWIRSAPAFSTALISSPSRLKSADRMDGAICFFILWPLSPFSFDLEPAAKRLIAQHSRRVYPARIGLAQAEPQFLGLFCFPREEDKPVGDLLGRHGPSLQGARPEILPDLSLDIDVRHPPSTPEHGACRNAGRRAFHGGIADTLAAHDPDGGADDAAGNGPHGSVLGRIRRHFAHLGLPGDAIIGHPCIHDRPRVVIDINEKRLLGYDLERVVPPVVEDD